MVGLKLNHVSKGAIGLRLTDSGQIPKKIRHGLDGMSLYTTLIYTYLHLYQNASII